MMMINVMICGEWERMTRTKTKRRRVRKSERMLTLPEVQEAEKRFWSNTQVIRFEVGSDGEKRPVRSKVQRVVPSDFFDFRKGRKK